jgi:hypothetical protein
LPGSFYRRGTLGVRHRLVSNQVSFQLARGEHRGEAGEDSNDQRSEHPTPVQEVPGGAGNQEQRHADKEPLLEAIVSGISEQGRDAFRESAKRQDEAGSEKNARRQERRRTGMHRFLPFYAVVFSAVIVAEVALHPTVLLVVLTIGLCAITAVIVVDRLHERRTRSRTNRTTP